jgi:hypothetical protein
MLYGCSDPGTEWKIATDPEPYLQGYIPRVYKFSASRGIKIVDLSDYLESQSLTGPRTEAEEQQSDQARKALQILRATPLKTRDPVGNWLHGSGGYLWQDDRFERCWAMITLQIPSVITQKRP